MKLTVLEYGRVLRVFSVSEEKAGDIDGSCNQTLEAFSFDVLCQIP